MSDERKRFRDRLNPENIGTSRRIARQLYLDCRGDVNMAESLAEEYVRDYGFLSSILVAVMVELIVALIKWWFEKGVTEPGPMPMRGEPGGDDE